MRARPMTYRPGAFLAFGFLALAGCGGGSPRHDPDAGKSAAQVKAEKALMDVSAGYELSNDPGHPAVAIMVHNAKIKDEDLAYFQDFPELQRVDLSDTGVGNAGVAHLGGVAKLRELN